MSDRGVPPGSYASAMWRNRGVRAGLVVLATALAGCSGGNGGGQAASGPTATPSRSPTARPARTSTAARPPGRVPTTPAPRPVEGHCPYAGSQQIADAVGQHIDRTTVTPTRPYPGCSFYRPNGEQAADIQVTRYGTAAAAQARAIALGGSGANPVAGVGDGGTVRVTATGAVLAVSKGPALVVVRINQRISLEAREIAGFVVARL